MNVRFKDDLQNNGIHCLIKQNNATGALRSFALCDLYRTNTAHEQ